MAKKLHWLTSPRTKLDRGIEHIECLERETQAFIEAEPYYVAAQFEAEESCYVARFRFREMPPLRLNAIVGDVVANLRSALDHIAWILACQENPLGELLKPEIRRGIYFPITHHPNEFAAHSLLPLISEDAKAALEGLQPDDAGTPMPTESPKDGVLSKVHRHPATALNHLWNVDKHRVIHGAMAQLDISTVAVTPAAIDAEFLLSGVDVEWTGKPNAPIEDGTEIARVRFKAGPPDTPDLAKVNVSSQPTVKIEFSGGGLVVDSDDLRKLSAYVLRAIDTVEPLYPA